MKVHRSFRHEEGPSDEDQSQACLHAAEFVEVPVNSASSGLYEAAEQLGYEGEVRYAYVIYVAFGGRILCSNLKTLGRRVATVTIECFIGSN